MRLKIPRMPLFGMQSNARIVEGYKLAMSQCHTFSLITPVTRTSQRAPVNSRLGGDCGMGWPRCRYSRRNNESTLVAAPRVITFW